MGSDRKDCSLILACLMLLPSDFSSKHLCDIFFFSFFFFPDQKINNLIFFNIRWVRMLLYKRLWEFVSSATALRCVEALVQIKIFLRSKLVCLGAKLTDLKCNLKCISLYLNREWDVIISGVVNHFRLSEFKARLCCSHFIGSTTPFQTTATTSDVSFKEAKPSAQPGQGHRSALGAVSWSAPVVVCSILHSSHSRLFPEPFHLQSFKFPFSLQLWEVQIPLSPTAWAIPDSLSQMQ